MGWRFDGGKAPSSDWGIDLRRGAPILNPVDEIRKSIIVQITIQWLWKGGVLF